jgi:hypothetical protein
MATKIYQIVSVHDYLYAHLNKYDLSHTDMTKVSVHDYLYAHLNTNEKIR